MTAALFGPGSGAPLAALGALLVIGSTAAMAVLHRHRPDLIDRLDEWLKDHHL